MRPRGPGPAPASRRPLPHALLLFLTVPLCGLGAPASPATPLAVERLELNVRLEPRLQALYVQAHFLLRNRGRESRDTLELDFPAPLGPRVQVRAAWDRGGELPWRSDPAEAGAPRTLLVGLRSPLAPGKKLVVAVSYDVDLEGFLSPGAALSVSSEGAHLLTTGWYPLPAGSDSALPLALRLTVRLPKEWQVEAPARLKQLRDGAALATYELKLQRIEPGQLLLRAGIALPP